MGFVTALQVVEGPEPYEEHKYLSSVQRFDSLKCGSTATLTLWPWSWTFTV